MEDLKPDDPLAVGSYRILKRIGSGGMGVVYLASDLRGQQVALKLIRAELAEDPVFRPRFRREVEAGKRVSGVCTARYLDVDVDADRPYLVTEYIEGGNLADYVAANGPLSGDQLVGLAVGLAEAIVAIHASGVIHRDLKPSNVLMSSSGPKVVDFGIAHAVEGTAVTQTGLFVGSPAWMAPEQAQGHLVSPGVDVFAWGATVAFAATGRSPFGEGRPDALVYRVVHEEPDLVGVETRLQPVVAEALRKEPDKRPADDALLVRVVKSAMGGEAPAGDADAMTTLALDRTWHQDPTQSKQRRVSPRQLAWVAASIIVIAAFIAGVVYVAHGDAAKPPTRPLASQQVAHARSPSSTTTTTTTTTESPSTSTSTSVPSTAQVEASLPVVSCATSYGATPQPTGTTLPSYLSVEVPQDLTSQLAVYTDIDGDMKIIAPLGWSCSANFGADGSGGINAAPSGQPVSTGSLAADSTQEAVSASETSACTSCTEDQACPLFAIAQADEENDYQQPCPRSRPPSESVVPLNANVVSFEDPPGVSGDADPSGGAYPANGVMTYYPEGSPNAEDGSYTETCVLPQSEMAICTTALDRFVDWYGDE